MDFGSLWNKATAAAAEAAEAAREQAMKAAEAASEQAARVQASGAFEFAKQTVLELQANTIATAEAAEANLRTFMENDDEKAARQYLDETSPEAFGITYEFVEFVRGITVDTFVKFPIEDLERQTGAGAGGEGGEGGWEMTPWQEVHARLMLKHVQEVSDFRYVLVPKHLDDEQFWRVYFCLTMPRLEALMTEAEAKAEAEMEAQMARLNQLGVGGGEVDEDGGSGVLVGVQEAGEPAAATAAPRAAEDGDEVALTAVPDATEDRAPADDDDDADADNEVAALLAAAASTADDGAAGEGEEGDEADGEAGGGDPELEAYLKGMLEGDGDDDDDDDDDDYDDDGEGGDIDLGELIEAVQEDAPTGSGMQLTFSASDASALEDYDLQSVPESGASSDSPDKDAKEP